MGLLLAFIINSAILVGISCLIIMEEGVFTQEKETRRDFWIDPEIRRNVVSSSIGLSFLFLFYSGVLGPPHHPQCHRRQLLFLPEPDGIEGLQERLAQNEDSMAGSGFFVENFFNGLAMLDFYR